MRSLLTKFAAKNSHQTSAGAEHTALDPVEVSDQHSKPFQSSSIDSPNKSPAFLQLRSAEGIRDTKNTINTPLPPMDLLPSSKQRTSTLDVLLNLPKSATARVYRIEHHSSKSSARDSNGTPLRIPKRRGSFDITDMKQRALLFDDDSDSLDSRAHLVPSPVTPVTGLVSISRPGRTPSSVGILPAIRNTKCLQECTTEDPQKSVNTTPHEVVKNGTSRESAKKLSKEIAKLEPHDIIKTDKSTYPVLHNMTPRDQVAVKKQMHAAILRSSTFDSSVGMFLTTYKQANGQEYRVYTKDAWPPLNAAPQRKPRTTTRSTLWLHRLITAILSERYKEIFTGSSIKEDCSVSDDFNCFLFKYMRKKHCTSTEMKKATKELMETLNNYKELIYSQVFFILLRPLNHVLVEGLLELIYLQYIEKEASFSLHNSQTYNLITGKLRQLDISLTIKDFFIGQLIQFKQEFRDDTITDFIQFLVSMDSELDLVVSGQRKVEPLGKEKVGVQKAPQKPSTVLKQIDNKPTQEHLDATETTSAGSPDLYLSPLRTAPSPLPPLHHSNVINAAGHASLSPSLQSPMMALTVPMESPIEAPPVGLLRKVASASVIKEKINRDMSSRRASVHSDLTAPRNSEILIYGTEHFEKKIADDSHFDFVEKDRKVRFDTIIKGIKYTFEKGERGFHRNVLDNDSKVESTDLLSFFEILKLS